MTAQPSHAADANPGSLAAAPARGAAHTLAHAADRLLGGIALGFRAAGIAALVLAAFRIAFVLRYGKALPAGASVLPALGMGSRFDLKTACVAFLPVVLLEALSTWRALRIARTAWLSIVFFALALTSLVNDGFYGFFQRPLDALVFGFVDDDTSAVWHSVWHEHPVVLGGLAAAAIAAVATRLALGRRRGERRPWAGSLRARVAMIVAAAAILVLAIRGRATGFPLNEQDLTVSAVPFVNAATPNGVFSLWLAWKQRESLQIGSDPREGLRWGGFETPAAAAAVLGLAPPDASDDAVAVALFQETPENPVAAARPPHVVVSVMEGWGADLLRYHSPQNDLLGRLAPHAARGIVFRRFLAAQNGTDPTLEALLVNSPISPLTYSARGNQHYTQAAALPFRAAGYRTVFAIGGSRSWRNIGDAMRNQGFDEIRDQEDVIAAYPDARRNIWGVHDGELFRWAAARLREADARGERLFLVLMSITNHTPHEVPRDYRVGPLDPAAFGPRRLGDPALRRSILETYQYACDALGGFMDEVEEAGLADRTIVAATGDHGTRSFFEYGGSSDVALRDAVPLLLVVPPAYLGGRTVDVTRWASHRDLFPTLAGLALSRARIFRSGDDLLAPPARPPRALTMFDLAISDAGATQRSGGGPLRWDGGALVPCADDTCRKALEAIAREERAYVGLLDWNVRRQVIGAGRIAAAAGAH
jgi:phosphoglycerol transferase MdoB-like AlkP superfamily enzyme